MDNLFDQSTYTYSAVILDNHLNAIEQETTGIRTAQDIEYIHRMRVATRRLRTSLSIFSSCYGKKKVAAWQAEIRRVTLALGAARDTDVQISKLYEFLNLTPEKQYLPGIKRLILRLSQQRKKLQESVISTLDNLISSGVLGEMKSSLFDLEKTDSAADYSLPLFQLAYSDITKRLDSLLSFEVYIYHVECIDELHAMRIAAKRLRYTMENFATLYPDQLKIPLQTVRKTQDFLGNIHDCDVWSQFLIRFIKDEQKRVIKYTGSPSPFNFLIPGIRHFQESCLKDRQMIYQQFIIEWQDWQQEGLWEKLRQIIRQPLTPTFKTPVLDNSILG
jgi:CHAD domain-containing protein